MGVGLSFAVNLLQVQCFFVVVFFILFWLEIGPFPVTKI